MTIGDATTGQNIRGPPPQSANSTSGRANITVWRVHPRPLGDQEELVLSTKPMTLDDLMPDAGGGDCAFPPGGL